MCLKQKPGKSITEFCLNPVHAVGTLYAEGEV